MRSSTTTPTAPKHHCDSDRSAVSPPSPSVDPLPQPPSMRGRPARGATTLFEVPFASVMGNGDLALLARMLDLSTRMHPKLRPWHDSPGLARLDHYSGLFLERGVIDGAWRLEARTWGHPAAQSVHGWHVLAAGAARQLDPTVIFPERLQGSAPEIRPRALGRAANKPLARFRRRLVGLA
jgi:hypothetical protein